MKRSEEVVGARRSCGCIPAALPGGRDRDAPGVGAVRAHARRRPPRSGTPANTSPLRTSSGFRIPPGNPLFVVLARAWDVLLSPLGLSIGGAHQPVQRDHERAGARLLVPAGAPHPGVLQQRAASSGWSARAVAVLVSATAFTVWNQSNVNEKVYTVSLFTIALLSWLAFRWRDHLGEGKDDNLHPADGVHPGAVGGQPPDGVPGGAGAGRLHPVGRAAHAHQLEALRGRRAGRSCSAFRSTCSCRCAPGSTRDQRGGPDLSDSGLGACRACSRWEEPVCGPVRVAVAHAVPEAVDARATRLTRSIAARRHAASAQIANYFQYFDWQWARSVDRQHAVLRSARARSSRCCSSRSGVFGAWRITSATARAWRTWRVLFLTLSLGLDFYLNFKYGYSYPRRTHRHSSDTEVRERDYFFIVSFSIWGLWAGHRHRCALAVDRRAASCA